MRENSVLLCSNSFLCKEKRADLGVPLRVGDPAFEHEEGPALVPSRVGEWDTFSDVAKSVAPGGIEPFFEGEGESSFGLIGDPVGNLRDCLQEEFLSGLEALACGQGCKRFKEEPVNERDSEFEAMSHTHDVTVSEELVAHVPVQFESTEGVFICWCAGLQL